MFGFILRFARQVVANIMSQLMKQFDVIEQQAANPMKAMVQQVMGGAWVGKGADAFVEEVSNLMLPGVGQIGDGISTFHKNIANAIQVMDRADQAVSNMVNGLMDEFANIF